MNDILDRIACAVILDVVVIGSMLGAIGPVNGFAEGNNCEFSGFHVEQPPWLVRLSAASKKEVDSIVQPGPVAEIQLID